MCKEIPSEAERDFIHAAVTEQTALMDDLRRAVKAGDNDHVLAAIARELDALEMRIAAGPDRESAA